MGQVSFEGSEGDYDQKDAKGFIKVEAVRLRNYGRVHGKIMGEKVNN